MFIGKAIKICRERKGISRLALAESTELSTSYISLLENNKRDPSLSKIQSISEALGVPIAILFFLATDKSQFETINPELAEKLSLFTLKLIEKVDDNPSLKLPF